LITVLIAVLFNASSGLSIRIPLWIFGDYTTGTDSSDYAEGKQLV
jgi:FLVCR family feline leukemia virus subgroup C receptor-related protein